MSISADSQSALTRLNCVHALRQLPRTLTAAARAVTICTIAALVWQQSTAAGEQQQQLDQDGTLNVPALKWPPSDYWSTEFAKAYAEHMIGTLSAPPNFGVPVMNAPRSDWEKFDAAVGTALAQAVARDLDHYRVANVETTIGSVHAAILTPKDGIAPQNQHRVLLNLHGFSHGLSEGQIESIPIAAVGRIKVITIDYRLEPYFRYPASSQDVEVAYKALIKQYRPQSIGFFGSSGGGVLVAQAVAWLQAKGLPRPGAVGIFWSGLATAPFPWGKSGDSRMWGFRSFPTDNQSEVDKLHADLGSWYLGGVADDDPQAYPGSSDAVLAKFPPTLFLTGTRAVDMSPSIAGHARLLKLNVDSSLYVMEGAWHGANVGGSEDSAEKTDANTYVARWFDRHLDR